MDDAQFPRIASQKPRSNGIERELSVSSLDILSKLCKGHQTNPTIVFRKFRRAAGLKRDARKCFLPSKVTF